MQLVDRVGSFRGRIVKYGLHESDKTKSKGVILTVELDEFYDSDEWHEWEQYEMEVSGYLNIIKKDGALNEIGVRSLVDHAGWDGILISLVEGTWSPKPIQVKVGYNDRNEFSISYVNAHDSTPNSGGGNVTPDRAKALQQEYGAQLRALAGNTVRNAKPPAEKPRKPVPPARRPVQEVAADPEALNAELAAASDDAPF